MLAETDWGAMTTVIVAFFGLIATITTTYSAIVQKRMELAAKERDKITAIRDVETKEHRKELTIKTDEVAVKTEEVAKVVEETKHLVNGKSDAMQARIDVMHAEMKMMSETIGKLHERAHERERQATAEANAQAKTVQLSSPSPQRTEDVQAAANTIVDALTDVTRQTGKETVKKTVSGITEVLKENQ